MNYYLAIDIGASSGRHILGHLEGDRMVLEEIHRFDNKQVLRGGHDCWDMDNLRRGIVDGLKACGRLGKVPATVGIDTWGVDFVLLDKDDKPLGDAVAYRDSRTDGMDAVVSAAVPDEQLYAATGIQKQPYNTVYQLMALKKEHPEQLCAAEWLLMMPDYLNFLLTGVKCNEYTEATTSGLINAEAKDWDKSIIRALGLPERIFHTPAAPGTVLGNLREEVRREVGFDTIVILPTTHDTGSAFLAVPARDDNAVYISSGTWSLLGVENDRPITTAASREQNFTNEGGAFYRFRYLKNIMGLWMIQSVRRELNGVNYVEGKQQRTESDRQWSFGELAAAAEEAEEFSSVIDVDRPCFLAPDSMIEAIKAECERTGQPVPQTVGEVMQCIYSSLSDCYRRAIQSLRTLTGKQYTSVNIVGGGCQDDYLNRRTSQATGLPVYAGPVEGTAIGNLMVQMIAAGEIADLQAGRNMVSRSFGVKEIHG